MPRGARTGITSSADRFCYLPPQNPNLAIEPAARPSIPPHNADPAMSAITIHPGTIANKGRYMDSMKGGDISRQELAGIYIIEGRDILRDNSVSIATLFPKVSSQAMWMVLCRADVLRAV
jgi:hypothetical protein